MRRRLCGRSAKRRLISLSSLTGRKARRRRLTLWSRLFRSPWNACNRFLRMSANMTAGGAFPRRTIKSIKSFAARLISTQGRIYNHRRNGRGHMMTSCPCDQFLGERVSPWKGDGRGLILPCARNIDAVLPYNERKRKRGLILI